MTTRVPKVFRLASVSFLNARPLIYGLENDPRVALSLDVPSRLIDRLRDRTADVALLPTIDYQRLPDLRIIPAGGIGCDGPTLTVRIFSQRPIERITALACDPDSHTSVALARIILAERYGLVPEFIDLTRATGRAEEARLLIGDKVVCEEPAGFRHQFDLGAEWKRLTGLPFVFAVWTAPRNVELGDLPSRLARAKDAGIRHVRELVERYAVPAGWPARLALQYLTNYLRFDISDSQLDAIECFHALASKHGVIDRVHPLATHSSGQAAAVGGGSRA
jgi:chorismate dehydratase